MFIYFWDRDRAWTGDGQREGDTESETGSRLWAVSTEPDAGLELTDREIMTWAKVGRLTDWAIQVPLFFISEKGGREADGERERILSRLHSEEPNAGAESHNPGITTWAEVKSWTLKWLSHPDAPNF